MWTRQHKQRKTGALIIPVVSAVVVTYFGFHAWSGDYGLASKHRLEARIDVLTERLDQARTQRIEMERRISLLADGTMERDMLDEHVRHSLDLVHQDEVVIFLQEQRN
jgi:cell division protein FtsB